MYSACNSMENVFGWEVWCGVRTKHETPKLLLWRNTTRRRPRNGTPRRGTSLTWHPQKQDHARRNQKHFPIGLHNQPPIISVTLPMLLLMIWHGEAPSLQSCYMFYYAYSCFYHFLYLFSASSAIDIIRCGPHILS